LTLLVRRAQKVHLPTQAPAEPLERAACANLEVLPDEGPTRPGRLAGRFPVDASTVSRLVSDI